MCKNNVLASSFKRQTSVSEGKHLCPDNSVHSTRLYLSVCHEERSIHLHHRSGRHWHCVIFSHLFAVIGSIILFIVGLNVRSFSVCIIWRKFSCELLVKNLVVNSFIIWLAPSADKVNQIARCDWLPEWARWRYLARSGLPAVSRKKNSPKSRKINPLLTNLVRSRWLDIGKRRTWPKASHLVLTLGQ